MGLWQLTPFSDFQPGPNRGHQILTIDYEHDRARLVRWINGFCTSKSCIYLIHSF